MVDETLPEKIDLLRQEIRALTQAVQHLGHEVHGQSEMVGRLVNLLTPDEKKPGPSLAQEMAKLVGQVEHQNRVLESLTGAIIRFMRDMPAAVARGVTEATGGLGVAIQDLPGKVLLAVRDARP